MASFYNESYEPMDVDLSSQSVKDMDISYGESADLGQSYSRNEVADASIKYEALKFEPYPNTPVIKKYHIVKEKPQRNDQNLNIIILSSVLLLFLSIVIYHLYNIECSDELNIEIFSETLSRNVFGQAKAITTILEVFSSKESYNILFFYGGTGVGKSYVSSLLLDTVGLSSNVYHYTMPSFKHIFSSEVMLGLTLCQSSLLIVDDLTENDMHIVEQIQEVITKAENLKRHITVILIFNCQETTKELFKRCDKSFNKKLLDNFSGIKALKSFVKFETLTQKDLRKCIEQEIGNKTLNDAKFSEIMAHFNVTSNGCKGVHSKMKYLNVF